MSITVRLYAGVKETVGRAAVDVELKAGADVRALREALGAACPEIEGQLPYCRFALSDRFVGDETELPDGATVDVIPPVSGG